MDEVVRALDQLRYKAIDYCDNPGSPEAKEFQKFAHDVYDQAKRGIPADKVLWKLKELRARIEQLKGNDELYDLNHVDDMHDRCEDIRKELEKIVRS